jgi:hypothetical protein
MATHADTDIDFTGNRCIKEIYGMVFQPVTADIRPTISSSARP